MGKKYLFDKRGSLISEIQEIARTHSLYVILSDENIQYSINSSTQVEPVEEVEDFIDGNVVLCIYNVTSTEEPTHLYHKMGSSGSGNGENTEVFTSMKIDGIEQQEIVDYYTFNTIGKHKVLYTLTDPTDVGKFMFQDCKNITSIILGNSIENFASSALEGVYTINSLTIGRAFSNDEGGFQIKEFGYIKVHPDNQKYDSRNNCNAIIETSTNKLYLGSKNTIIPNSVTSIGDSAFSRCSGLTSITIPDSVTSIGDGAFSDCTGLTNITIPNSVTSIGAWVFGGCTGLTSITIPNSVTSIGGRAFASCSRLTSITIPDSVTSIGYEAFASCSRLTNITCNATIAPTINKSTFYDIAPNGTLTVPVGSTSYDVWMGTDNYYLGKYNWTKVEK